MAPPEMRSEAEHALAPARGWRVLPTLAQCVAAGCAAATLLAAAARSSWLADLATHFPWQYAFAAAAAAAILAWHRRLAWALAAMLVAAGNAYIAWPDEAQSVVQTGARPALRVLHTNVFFGNDEYSRVIALVRAQRPDIAVFVEVTPRWRVALAQLEGELPFAREAIVGRHGVLVLSRRPAREWHLVPTAGGLVPFVHGVFELDGRRVDFYGVHANWPLGEATSLARNRQLRQLASSARNARGAVIIAGDLNVTRHSPHFVDLLEQGELRPAAQGAWTSTWPTFFPAAGIQIDHVLVSDELVTSRFEIGPRVGSDHRPVIADLAWRGS